MHTSTPRVHLQLFQVKNVVGDPSSLSGARLKQSAEPINGTTALDIIAQCGGSVYTRIDTNEKRVGMIAQDVDAAIAGLGVGNDSASKMTTPGDLPFDEYKTLDYSRIVALLCPAVTELKKEVAELKQQLQKRKARA